MQNSFNISGNIVDIKNRTTFPATVSVENGILTSISKEDKTYNNYLLPGFVDAHIHIDYSSPGVRDRIIFGGLVSYDSIWQAGAHMATWIEANKDLVINDETLKAGKYGFFVIPSQKEWTIIFNTNWEQHGKDEYDVKDDVIRFSVTPVISDSITEHLEYKVTKTGETEGVISLSWEKVTVSFSFKVRT